MSNAPASTLLDTRHDTRNTAAPDRQLSTTKLLGIASLIALALVAGAQWGDTTAPERAEIERPAAEVGGSADQTVFDGRGKWGGYAR